MLPDAIISLGPRPTASSFSTENVPINPPDKVKYQYWTKGKVMTSIADWQASAAAFPGSWWPYWIEWLSQQSGGWTARRAPGARLGVIEDAPGSYVKAKH